MRYALPKFFFSARGRPPQVKGAPLALFRNEGVLIHVGKTEPAKFNLENSLVNTHRVVGKIWY